MLSDGPSLAWATALALLAAAAPAQAQVEGQQIVNDQVVITGISPKLFYDDTDEAGSTEWSIVGSEDVFIVRNFDTLVNMISFSDAGQMQIELNSVSFEIEDEDQNRIVDIHRDAPLSLDIRSDGNIYLSGSDLFVDNTNSRVGMGTSTPSDDLEIASFTPGVVLNDTSTSSADWYIGNSANDLILQTKGNGTGGPSNKTIVRLDAQTGNVEIHGKLILDGELQVAPDYVFEPDYPLETIEEHARRMWENKHLPAVPPAAEIEENGLDLVRHQYGTLEELEKAHIYISQLSEKLMEVTRTVEDLQAEVAELKKQDRASSPLRDE